MPDTDTLATASFARTANAYLRQLHVYYLDALRYGDDEAVIRHNHAANVVERAACIQAAAHSLAVVRSSPRHSTSRSSDSAAAKAFLIGVQARLTYALAEHDIEVLERICDAADAAMLNLAHPDAAFRDLERHAAGAVDFEARATKACEQAANAKNFETEFVHRMHKLETEYGSDDDEECEWKPSLFNALFSMNKQKRIAILIYFFLLLVACISVGLITQRYISNTLHPHSFLRITKHESLPMPVVTLCLSGTGVPHSRLLVSNFTDANGKIHRIGDSRGDYLSHAHKSFDGTVERFWDNEDQENCSKKIGDHFPFPAKSLNAIAAGRTSSKCRPCYRFGQNPPLMSRSTKFENSSSLLLFTDTYAMQCLLRPGGLSRKAEQFLRREVYQNLRAPKPTLQTLNILSRAGSGSLGDLTLSDIQQLSGKQLCNIFYFALFPKQLAKLRRDDKQVKYQFTGEKWRYIGTGAEFIPRKRKKMNSDLNFMENLEIYVTNNSTIQHGTIAPERNASSPILIGPSTQPFVALKWLEVYNDVRFETSTTTTHMVDSEPEANAGYWLKTKIYWNYNRFISEAYYEGSDYPLVQWLVDLMSYVCLFTGAAIFSIFLLPISMEARARQKKRKRTKANNPEAYLLRTFRKSFHNAPGIKLSRANSKV